MADKTQYQLVKKIYELTRDGRLTWEEGAGTRAFKTQVNPYNLQIREVDDPEVPDSPDYGLEVFNASGRWVESIYNYSLRAFADEKVDELAPYGMLQAIYRKAHRQALKVDEVISNVLAKLEQLPPF